LEISIKIHLPDFRLFCRFLAVLMKYQPATSTAVNGVWFFWRHELQAAVLISGQFCRSEIIVQCGIPIFVYASKKNNQAIAQENLNE